MTLDRRSLLKCAGLVPILGAMPRLARAASDVATEKADYTLHIATGLVELAPDHIVSTTLYNGQFPGPLLRFTQGQKTVVDGPIAHIGYFREEFVVRRRWLDEPAYADLVGLCQFLPGPASSQVDFSSVSCGPDIEAALRHGPASRCRRLGGVFYEFTT